MKNFILDIGSIIGSFTLVDYILFFSVVVLIMLFVSLVYVMYEEKSMKKEKEEYPLHKEEPKKEKIKYDWSNF